MATAANAISPEGRQQRTHDLVVPPWAEALPCCLFVLVKFFYLDLLLPDDTFVAAMRKALIAIGPWAFFCAPFLNAVLRLIRDGDKFGSEPNVAVGLLLALGIWAPLYLGIFAFAKCQPHRAGSGAITDLWTLGITTRSRRSSVVSSPSDPQPRHSASRRRRAVGIVPGAPSYAIGDGYAAEHPPAVPQLRTVAMAELRFTLRELRTDGPHGTRRLMALHGFVDRVHEVARATKAAVHAFVGDAVVASWNAARACAHPEAKAARFAARLRTDPALQVTGAVVSGMGTVLMAGLGEQRALVLSLQADAQALLRRAAHQGTRRDAILLPTSMAATVEFAVEHELGAVLYAGDDEAAARKHDADGHAPVDPSSVLVLHAIMREVPPERDDWVYVLEQQQGSAALSSSGLPPEPQPAAGSQKLRSVADALCAGRLSEALALLNAAAPPEGSPEHAAHAMLHQDIQEVARRSSAAR